MKLFTGAETMMPGPAYDTLQKAVAMGEPALPSILALAVETDHPNRLFLLCEAIERMDVRDDRVALYLEPKLRSDSPFVVSVCGQAVAHSLPVGSEDLPLVWRLVTDPSIDCNTRRNIAAALREPAACETMAAMSLRPGCDQMTGVYGLGSCPGSQDRLLAIAGDAGAGLDVREGALAMLRRLEPAPQGRDLYLWWIRAGDEPGPSNCRAFALELLADVGTRDDLPLLRQIIRDDPYDGEGIDAVNARKAIRAIERR